MVSKLGSVVSLIALLTLLFVGCGDSTPAVKADQRLPDIGIVDRGIDSTSDLALDHGANDSGPDAHRDAPADTASAPDRGADRGQGADLLLFDDHRVVDLLADGQPKADVVLLDKGPTEGGPTDALPTADGPTTCAAAIGLPCSSGGNECGSAATCLLTDSTAGVCVCPCTADNPQTPLVNEDSCPDLTQNICSPIRLASGALQPFCLRRCKPRLGANDCAAPLACVPGSARFSPQADVAVCLLTGCQSGADCPVITATACDTQTTPCPSGQTCLPFLSGGTAGSCALPGVCDVPSGLCGVHNLGNASAQIGAPCQSDLDCAGSMRCERAFDAKVHQKAGGLLCSGDDECCSGICSGGLCAAGPCLMHSRNGYCTKSGCAFASTLTKAACGVGAACSLLYYGGTCLETCDLTSASSCRGVAADLYGDYECRAWNNLVIGGVPITSAPVCEWGESIPCDFFAGTALDCSSLGLANNSTQMGCRGFDGAVKASPTASDGYCFDTTSSGTNQRIPLP